VPADERVRVAIENWAPRFVANGVDLNDFQRVTARIERWEDWCREWSACAATHERLAEQAEADRCYISAGQHYFHAALAYHFGKFVLVQRPDELRAAHERAVGAYQRALPYFDFPGERVAIPYDGGVNMYGILRRPWHAARPPVVILIPGLDSVKEELHAYGDDLLRRGMAVLAIDGPGQGEMEFTHPMRFDYEVPVWKRGGMSPPIAWACSASASEAIMRRARQHTSRVCGPPSRSRHGAPSRRCLRALPC